MVHGSFEDVPGGHGRSNGVALEEQASEVKMVRLELMEAAYRCGWVTEDETELTEKLAGVIAYRLADDIRRRKGAWPDSSVGQAQRAWDYLMPLDATVAAAWEETARAFEDADEAARMALPEVSP